MAHKTPMPIPTTDIKIFIGLGIAGIILLVTLPIFTLGYFLNKETEKVQTCEASGKSADECREDSLFNFLDEKINDAAQSSTEHEVEPTPSGGLGSEGSVCGGVDRLPCLPTLKCMANEGDDMGVCLKDAVVRYEGGSRQVGEACGRLSADCGLREACVITVGSNTGICRPETETSPKVMSLKIEKANFENNGIYTIEAGLATAIEVETVNASSGRIDLVAAGTGPNDPEAKKIALGALTAGKTGLMTGSVTLPAGFEGYLLVRLASKDGQVTVMGVNVTAK